MSPYNRFINITIQLGDGRVLISRKACNEYVYTLWSLTSEYILSADEDPLSKVNRVMWDIYGIDTSNYVDNFVSMRMLKTLTLPDKSAVTPFVVQLKAAFAFQTEKTTQFEAMPWSIALLEIEKLSVRMGIGALQKHTTRCIHVASVLDTKKVMI